MKLLKTIWKKIIGAKNGVVNFFTDGKPNVGPLGKLDIIEIVTFTTMCLIPVPIHAAVALPIRYGLCKTISLVLFKTTSMGTVLSYKALVTGIVVSAAALLVTATSLYVFNIALPTAIVGAIISISTTLAGM